MYRILNKIATTPRVVIPRKEILTGDISTIGAQLKKNIRILFHGSLSIRQVAAGSSNAEEQELTALGNVYYDIERFGIRFVASPRHADMLMVTGPVSVNMAEALRRTYAATPDPKLVVAVGDGAIDGSVFRDSYAVYNGVSDIIPVDFVIPGDPPSPKMILAALLTAFEDTAKEKSLAAKY